MSGSINTDISLPGRFDFTLDPEGEISSGTFVFEDERFPSLDFHFLPKWDQSYFRKLAEDYEAQQDREARAEAREK